MRKSMFALAVFAATLPGLALAGDTRPAQMSDDELDNVAAGLSISDKLLQTIRDNPDQITSDPRYPQIIQKLRDNQDKISLRLQNSTFSARIFEKVPKESLAKVLPPDLRPMLDQVRVK